MCFQDMSNQFCDEWNVVWKLVVLCLANCVVVNALRRLRLSR